MAKKEYIKNKQGIVVYPVTHEEAVVDKDGVSLDVKLGNITGGMDILELSSGSGVLTEEQVTLVQSDHCIVKYDEFYYYKKVQGETTCTYNRVSEEKSERTTTDYYFTCTYSSGVFTFGSTVTPQGSPDAVKYVEQELTSEQKEQARTNIGAGTSSFSGNYNDLSNKPTIPTVPTISTDISADATSNTKTASPKAVKDYVDSAATTSANAVKYVAQSLTSQEKAQARQNIGAGTSDFSGDPIVGLSVAVPADGTLIATLSSGNTVTINLNHNHLQYPRYHLCEDEQEYEDIAVKDSDTLYLIIEE